MTWDQHRGEERRGKERGECVYVYICRHDLGWGWLKQRACLLLGLNREKNWDLERRKKMNKYIKIVYPTKQQLGGHGVVVADQPRQTVAQSSLGRDVVSRTSLSSPTTAFLHYLPFSTGSKGRCVEAQTALRRTGPALTEKKRISQLPRRPDSTRRRIQERRARLPASHRCLVSSSWMTLSCLWYFGRTERILESSI